MSKNYWQKHDSVFLENADLTYFDKNIVLAGLNQENALFVDIMKDSPLNSSFLDVGAYTGNTVIPVAKKLKELGREDINFHAFEPSSGNCLKIRQNANRNKLNIKVHECVVTEKEQPVYIKRGEGSGTMFDVCYVKNPSFPGKTLDSFEIENVHLIKIDVEGHETEVLKGAKITQQNTPYMYIEMWNNGHFNERHCRKNHDHNKSILEQVSSSLYPVQKIEKNVLFTSQVDTYKKHLDVFKECRVIDSVHLNVRRFGTIS